MADQFDKMPDTAGGEPHMVARGRTVCVRQMLDFAEPGLANRSGIDVALSRSRQLGEPTRRPEETRSW